MRNIESLIEKWRLNGVELVVERTKDENILLKWIYVIDQGRGLGSACIREVQELARTERKKIILWPSPFNPNVYTFYQKLGFIRDKEHPLIMVWSSESC